MIVVVIISFYFLLTKKKPADKKPLTMTPNLMMIESYSVREKRHWQMMIIIISLWTIWLVFFTDSDDGDGNEIQNFFSHTHTPTTIICSIRKNVQFPNQKNIMVDHSSKVLIDNDDHFKNDLFLKSLLLQL